MSKDLRHRVQLHFRTQRRVLHIARRAILVILMEIERCATTIPATRQRVVVRVAAGATETQSTASCLMGTIVVVVVLIHTPLLALRVRLILRHPR